MIEYDYLIVKDSVYEIISNVTALNEEDITNEDKLSDIGINSLSIVELLVKIENRLEITLNEGDLDPDKITTVGSILEMLSRYFV